MLSTAVIIPVHNRREVTLRCLERLESDGVFAWASVVVVDDGSTDGTGAAVRARHPAVILLPGDGDLWWGGAIRMGMEYAGREGAACFLWLNDDCLPGPGTLRLLSDHVGGTGGLATGWASTPSGGRYGGFRKTLGGLKQVTPPPPGGVVACDAAGGNCVAIARTVVDAIGLPDAARLPHALLDVDYLLTATRRGFPLDLLGSAVCRNDDNFSPATTSWLLDDASPMRQWKICLGHRSTQSYVASFRLHSRHWGAWGLWLFARGYLRLALVCVLRAVIPLRVLRAIYAARSDTWRRQQTYRRGIVATTVAASPDGKVGGSGRSQDVP